MAKKNSGVNLFKFRVIMDTEQDVFRDIEIETESNFDSLHKAVLDAFDFEQGEMASFYLSDEEWSKGLEISLMDMGGVDEDSLSMSTTILSDMVMKPGDKILYVYDFMRMWIFYIELMEVKKDKPSTIYPRVALAFGDAPSQDSKEFQDMFEADVVGGGADIDDLDDEEDEFGEGDDIFDEDEFDGSYTYDNE
ncbi:MAG: plasmid pRiA4b ORF-3 family protein [Flavobacteriales bacterium]|nr:plasmid pRiA4b ORF-3 family protein [Flavobacteriales bacterium]MDP4716966.1 plasmid pRiA4b ORF-3 family protein [Flavobacteriales bacterium]MDP4731287.1 plasmid pRiA4b ORF-3 family protein [Flavobacteriales bacterium]MDP4818805.1 plasmid pRiA4b ORF-3 family protein [Flavobacteriales bacterium]MDP4951276.1 plasmid pRiA4b ORF-3 family protein [Flavobacteriales bacterium]